MPSFKHSVSSAIGPDRIQPADGYTTTEADGYVRMRRDEEDAAPISVPTFMKTAAKKGKNTTALAVKRNGDWVKWTYSEYYDESRLVAKAFIKLGLEPRRGVAILGFNAPEWFMSQLGAIFAGGISCGIYPTNSPEACKYILQDSRTNILVVEDERQYRKVKEFRSDLKDLKTVIQYTGTPMSEGVLSWQKLLDIGRNEADDDLDGRQRKMAINECCHMVYTSGTTGSPKGVMLSHDNLTFTARVLAKAYNLQENCGDRMVSYLPLSHVAANVVDVFVMATTIMTLYFADKDALKGSLVTTLKEVRPTYFFGVPRVYEKIMERMTAVGKANKGLKKAVGEWAKKTGYQQSKRIIEGRGQTTFQYLLANQLVFSKVKESLGLEQCKAMASAAAPLGKHTQEYFSSLDIRIFEIFGMSECAGPQTGTTPNSQKFGTIGKSYAGFNTRLLEPKEEQFKTIKAASSGADLESNESGSISSVGHPGLDSGEICLRGRNVMMGYLGQPQKTDEVIDEDGWLRSGDIGARDNDGFLTVTGRIKEIIITAGGENIPPAIIEEEIKKELPDLISNVFLIGDKRKFLTCLITLKVSIDRETERPGNRLSKEARAFCETLGCGEVDSVTDILEEGENKSRDALYGAIQKAVDRANASATSGAQKVQKWSVIPGDFSVATGELGPTLKVKRHVVQQMNEEIIEKFYT